MQSFQISPVFSGFNSIIFLFSPFSHEQNLSTRSLHVVMAVEEGDWFFPVIPPYCNSSCCQVTYHSLAVVPSLRALLVHWPSLNHFPPSFRIVETSACYPLLLWRLKSWQLDSSTLSDHTLSSFLLQLLFAARYASQGELPGAYHLIGILIGSGHTLPLRSPPLFGNYITVSY